MTTHFAPDGHPVPPLFQHAVENFAADLQLDAAQLIQGAELQYAGERFWLIHYGEQDPHGATIFMDAGDIPPDRKTQACLARRLLGYNGAVPVAIYGHYGCVPGLNKVVYCMRVALDEVDDGAEAIALAISTSVEKKKWLQEELARHQAHGPANDTAAGMRI